ncbi:hypothetical protein BS50DRAFT_632310 [Corynespora cassiicola Philippines]|uniref:Uncharacterized protein n=1 Tax=Corynespora cassiicola Philippines TaxID=1448308 RepID=A0A2T2NYD1_CORCC|nr:hypothetical protein BS50DRAFT_632310 [Corynespora cassiicola Philippines]
MSQPRLRAIEERQRQTDFQTSGHHIIPSGIWLNNSIHRLLQNLLDCSRKSIRHPRARLPVLSRPIPHCANSPSQDVLKYALDDTPTQLRQWALSNQDPGSDFITTSQLAILRANIHVTHLWLQSILMDQLDSLTSPEENWPDHEVISNQLLYVLHNIA